MFADAIFCAILYNNPIGAYRMRSRMIADYSGRTLCAPTLIGGVIVPEKTAKAPEKAAKSPVKATRAKKAQKPDVLMYKGRPLVRSGNEIYYGDMAESVVARMEIRDCADFEDLKLPNKVRVFLLSTDESLNPLERMKKNSEKTSLYEAIETAAIWLDLELGK